MPVMNAGLIDRLASMAQRGINVLLTGAHGIGKTTMFKQLCDQCGMRGAYVNVPGADYFVDWMGIPAPESEPEPVRIVRWFTERGGDSLAVSYIKQQMHLDHEVAVELVKFIHAQREQQRLNFLRPKRLEGVEWVFFDEINREADPRFVDACMELVQFRTINGSPVRDLKLVWAAQNPPNGIYRVKELDKPLIDKFGAHIVVEGSPDYAWYVGRGYDPHTVSSVISWYDSDLKDAQRELVSPRCLENIMRLVDSGFDPAMCLLDTMGIPSHLLTAKLAKLSSSHRYASLDLATLQADPMTYIKIAGNDVDFCAFYTDLIRRPGVLPQAVLSTCAIFLAMPFEFQSKVMTDRKWTAEMRDAVQSPTLPGKITTVPGFQSFVEMLKQFK